MVPWSCSDESPVVKSRNQNKSLTTDQADLVNRQCLQKKKADQTSLSIYCGSFCSNHIQIWCCGFYTFCPDVCEGGAAVPDLLLISGDDSLLYPISSTALPKAVLWFCQSHFPLTPAGGTLTTHNKRVELSGILRLIISEGDQWTDKQI